jgi:DNA-binding LacI/PurR family transcriptional regulator
VQRIAAKSPIFCGFAAKKAPLNQKKVNALALENFKTILTYTSEPVIDVHVPNKQHTPNLTIKDIAKLAGVSHATVSRVLNHNTNVHPKTRNKIIKIISANSFTPQSSARSLVLGKTHTLGLLVLFDVFENSVPSLFLPHILSGMTAQLENTDYNLMLFFIRQAEKNESFAMRKLSPKHLDGLFVICRKVSQGLRASLQKIELPILVINQRIIDSDFSFVISDDVLGGYLAASHLLEQGHREVAFFGVDHNQGNTFDREIGFDNACEEYQPQTIIKLPSQTNEDMAYLFMNEYLKNGKKFTAIFSASDYMALGAMHAFHDAGIRVPDDIALIGYNNMEFTQFVQPSLSTVERPRTEIGREAVKVMMNLINDRGMGKETDPIHIKIKPELIIRESSVISPSKRAIGASKTAGYAGGLGKPP